MPAYLYVVRPCRDSFLDDATEAEMGVVAEHFSYLKSLTERRIVALAGRTEESQSFGIIVFEAANQDQAQQIVDADPAVAGNIFAAELHPFRLALERGSFGTPE